MQQPASNSHSSGAKYAVKASDMSDEMQKDAIDMAIESTSKWDTERDIAASLKKDFDGKYGPTWHCIVGSNFGSYVTHESRHFIYFYLNKLAILLYKSG
ncbi:Dynein light chain 2, cytoplasmic [Picochlorum sp. SENEW3]|nr:Dynein light chain 2, cytoplasmic [Picochlorum sp. SENEW3]